MLDLALVVFDLLTSQHIDQTGADTILGHHRSPGEVRMHPLEYIASLELDSQKTKGQKLDAQYLSQWLAELANQPYYTIDPLKIDAAAVVPVMSQAYAIRHEILAVEVNQSEIVVASAQPWHTGWEENLCHVNNKTIRRVVANPVDIRHYTQEFYRLVHSISGASNNKSVKSGSLNPVEQMLDLGHIQAPDANDQPIVEIVDWLLQYAFEQRASDIHIEPKGEQCHLRFRIDGVLHPIYQIPVQVGAAVTSRLKILARMNVAEKRKPQDGRLKTRHTDGSEVELRLSTLPTAQGEKLVMRVFDPQVLARSFKDLGFSKEDERCWTQLSRQSGGIILVTGPTGSGKTTTLYSTLKLLATEKVNICTVEDPIEMVEPSFNQMQVQQNIDLTFATGLRALLRQDPDIIMVGEIRDLETAEMAIQAALTGHLVLSTLHTNDAPSAITRLVELGVPPYLIKSTVLGVMAQRLVRTLCARCKTSEPLDKRGWQALVSNRTQSVPARMFKSVGCTHCRDTGYYGRTGLYEIMPVSESLKSRLDSTPDLARLRYQALKEGMHSLRLSGARKVARGETTIAEVLRVTPSPD